MSPRFKFKELIVVLPALLLVGGTFLWMRAGTHSGAGLFAREMFVESVDLQTASGALRARGYSHILTVKINHPWPQPSYWRGCCGTYQFYDASYKLPGGNFSLSGSGSPNRAAALGEVVWKHDGMKQIVPQNRSSLGYGNLEKQDGVFVFARYLALQEAASQGELEFNGQYSIAVKAPLKVHRVLRKAGQPLVFATNHDMGGRLVSIVHDNWQSVTTPSASNGMATAKPIKQESIDVTVRVRPLPQPAEDDKISLSISDCELVDGKGRVFPAYKGFNLGWTETSNQGLPAGEYQRTVAVMCDPTLKATNPLTLRGSFAIGDNWPQPFSIKLGARP